MADDVTFQPTAATPPTGTVVATDQVGTKHYQKMKLVDGTAESEVAAKVSAEGRLHALAPDRTASGTLDALDEAVTIACEGLASVAVYFPTSTLSGSISFEGTIDGSEWVVWDAWKGSTEVYTFQVVNPDPDTWFSAPVAHFISWRVRVDAYTSGSLSVQIKGSPYLPVYSLISAVNVSTELPAAAAITTENITRPDAPSVYSFPLVFDGANWDRAPGNSTDGTLVNLGANNDVVDTAAETSLAILDDWDESDRAKVNSIAGQVGVQGASGAVTALTQRVVLATDVALPAGTNNIGDVDVLSSALPTGAATAALQTQPGVDIGDVTVNNAQGSGTAAAALRVELPTNGTGVVGLNAGTNNIGDVDVASIAAGDNNIGNVDVVTLPALVAGSANIGDVDVLTVPAPLSTTGGGTEATALRVTVANNSTGLLPVSLTSTTITGSVDTELPAAAALADATVNPTVPTVGAFASVFNGTTWDRARGDTLGANVSRAAAAATAATSSVAGSASSVTLLALNAARKGAAFHNDSTALLYLKLGTTASTSDFTVKMVPEAYYEAPFGYTGRVDGIWASATGNARCTELT